MMVSQVRKQVDGEPLSVSLSYTTPQIYVRLKAIIFYVLHQTIAGHSTVQKSLTAQGNI